MLHRRRPEGLRLGIDLEAETLISNSGVDAYRIARRRADESSSHQMAKDWSKVAVAITRKTSKRPRGSLASKVDVAITNLTSRNRSGAVHRGPSLSN